MQPEKLSRSDGVVKPGLPGSQSSTPLKAGLYSEAGTSLVNLTTTCSQPGYTYIVGFWTCGYLMKIGRITESLSAILEC